MDDRRFDSLARSLASGASRRSVLKGLLGLGGGGSDRRNVARRRSGGRAASYPDAETGDLSRTANLEWLAMRLPWERAQQVRAGLLHRGGSAAQHSRIQRMLR